MFISNAFLFLVLFTVTRLAFTACMSCSLSFTQDNDIKALVRKLLDGANLEEVTMKNILTKVYAKYPDHDLTARKDFIKTTVKAVSSRPLSVVAVTNVCISSA